VSRAAAAADIPASKITTAITVGFKEASYVKRRSALDAVCGAGASAKKTAAL